LNFKLEIFCNFYGFGNLLFRITSNQSIIVIFSRSGNIIAKLGGNVDI